VETVRVPQVAMMNVNSAKSTLEEAGLKAVIIYAADGGYAADTVISQGTAYNTVVPVGSEVWLTVSTGRGNSVISTGGWSGAPLPTMEPSETAPSETQITEIPPTEETIPTESDPQEELPTEADTDPVILPTEDTEPPTQSSEELPPSSESVIPTEPQSSENEPTETEPPVVTDPPTDPPADPPTEAPTDPPAAEPETPPEMDEDFIAG